MSPEEILEHFGLSKTQVRINLISLLQQKDYALSEQEIRSYLPHKYNRTTIYRTIKSFIKKGIVHTIADEESTMRYVLNKEFTASSSFFKEHVHFKCQRCGRLFCLEDTPVKQYNLPEGFRRTKSEFLIIGICKECNEELNG